MAEIEEEETPLFHKVYDHANDLSKTDALKLCSGHLQGLWTTSTEEDIDLTVFQGGFVNRMFLCHNKKADEKVLIRLYGGKILNHKGSLLRHVGLEGEVLLYHLMDINRLGPKLLGVFDGGRIEKYIEGSNILQNEDIENDETMSCLARQLARMHSMTVPLDKNPKPMTKIIREQFDKHWKNYHELVLKAVPVAEDTPDTFKELIKTAVEYDWWSMISFFEDNIDRIKTRVVFSHNDMNRGNCIVVPSREGDDKIVLCDFEFSGYSHRGCDIGHHFKHRTVDFKKGFKNMMDQPIPYPKEEERRKFVKDYLEERKQHSKETDESLDNENQLLLECEFYGTLYQLFFLACLVIGDQGILTKLDLPIHPGVMMGGFVKDFLERKESIDEMRQRFSL